MKIRSIVAAVSLALASSLAMAHNCPNEWKKIDDALAKKPKLTDAQLAEVMKYRSEGEALHKQGKHTESMETLAKGQKILAIK